MYGLPQLQARSRFFFWRCRFRLKWTHFCTFSRFGRRQCYQCLFRRRFKINNKFDTPFLHVSEALEVSKNTQRCQIISGRLFTHTSYFVFATSAAPRRVAVSGCPPSGCRVPSGCPPRGLPQHDFRLLPRFAHHSKYAQ